MLLVILFDPPYYRNRFDPRRIHRPSYVSFSILLVIVFDPPFYRNRFDPPRSCLRSSL